MKNEIIRAIGFDCLGVNPKLRYFKKSISRYVSVNQPMTIHKPKMKLEYFLKYLLSQFISYFFFLRASMTSSSDRCLNESIIFLTMYEGVLSSIAPIFSSHSKVSSSILTDIILSFLAIVKSMNNTLYDVILLCMTTYDKGD